MQEEPLSGEDTVGFKMYTDTDGNFGVGLMQADGTAFYSAEIYEGFLTEKTWHWILFTLDHRYGYLDVYIDKKLFSRAV